PCPRHCSRRCEPFLRTPQGCSCRAFADLEAGLPPGAGAVTFEAGESMDIAIGADVIGTDGKLGEISDVIAESQTDQVVAIVVKHGMLFGRGRTIVPLGLVQRVEDGDIYVKLDRVTMEKGSEFVATMHADYVDYVGPPSQDNEGTFRGNLE